MKIMLKQMFTAVVLFSLLHVSRGSNPSKGQEKPATTEQNEESGSPPTTPRHLPLSERHDGDTPPKPGIASPGDKARDDKFSWVNILQAFGALATVAYAVVSALMLCALRRQAHFMKEQSVISRRTLGAIQRQADTMDRQTAILESSVRAAETSAQAAKTSADAFKGAERPWMLAEIDAGGLTQYVDSKSDANSRIVCSLKNCGRTPAKIRAFTMKKDQIDKTDKLPAEPNYESIDDPNTPLEGDIILPPNGLLQRPVYLPRLGRLAVQRGDALLYVYGYVIYDDEFRESHEARFCYQYKIPYGDPAIGGGFEVSGPVAYNKAT